MQVTQRSRLQIRLQNIVFVILFLAIVGMLAWLSTRYAYTTDWTASGRNSLSSASITLLETIPDQVNITAFVRTSEEREYVRQVITRYQAFKDDIRLKFVNPDTDPQLTRDMGITNPLELVIQHGNRSQNVANVTEQTITNALQRVARSSDKFIVFLTGHGERKIDGQANHDLRALNQQLENRGLRAQTINLVDTPQIPDNTAVLVIAGPSVALLPGEISIIKNWLENGGNLLWLAEPGNSLFGLEPVAEYLDIEFHPGTIVDPTTQLFGIADPRMSIVSSYNIHPVTENFTTMTLFPQAVSIELNNENSEWLARSLLQSAPGSWSETGEMKGELALDEGDDIAGPLTIVAALTREREAREQRVIVVGDGDFLSNSYLGNVGNLDLGMNIINWLSNQDNFISIPVKTSNDIVLQISPTVAALIGFGFWLILPIALLTTGIIIWLRRRRR